MEGGELSQPRLGLRATLVGDTLFVTGGTDDGFDDAFNDLTSILSWDPVADSWQSAGDLVVAREYHAAVAVPESLIDC